ncbi:MAG: MoxR family ATPase, partial [Cyclobacteriaceae bacterium]
MNEDPKEEETFENRLDLSQLANKMNSLKEEIGKKLVGQHQLVELVIAGILADGHVLIEGVPGVAKTFTAKLISRVLDADFSRI